MSYGLGIHGIATAKAVKVEVASPRSAQEVSIHAGRQYLHAGRQYSRVTHPSQSKAHATFHSTARHERQPNGSNMQQCKAINIKITKAQSIDEIYKLAVKKIVEI